MGLARVLRAPYTAVHSNPAPMHTQFRKTLAHSSSPPPLSIPGCGPLCPPKQKRGFDSNEGRPEVNELLEPVRRRCAAFGKGSFKQLPILSFPSLPISVPSHPSSETPTPLLSFSSFFASFFSHSRPPPFLKR